MPSIELGFTVSTVVLIVLVLVACLVSILFYRYTLPPVPSGTKIALIALRATALSLLLLLVFEPLLRLVLHSRQPSTLAVLVDTSRSMKIIDRAGDRAAELARVLGADALQQITDHGTLRYYTFGTRPAPAEDLDSLSLDGESTDIAAALRLVADDRERLNINGVLLLTDGSYNLGHNPIYEADQLGIPIYTVGIGDSTEQKDILITKVSTNELVYSETEVPVDVTIKSSGFGGERVDVTLAEGGTQIARTQLTVGEGTREYHARLTYTPQGEGVKRYTVRVSSLGGELTADNNRATFLARILKSKLRVLIIGGSPSPDLSIVRQTLVEEKNFTARSFALRSPSGSYGGEITPATIDSADCILLIGFPTSGTSDALLSLLRNALQQKAKPLLFIHGKSVDAGKLNAIAPVLPFTVGIASTAEQLVFIEISAAQRSHPILATGTDEGIESWKRLPPIFRTQSTYKAKAEATVLGVGKIHNVPLADPLMVIRNVNRQKSLAILGYEIWRWRLMAQGNPETEGLFATFLSNTIRWLTTREEGRPVKVATTREAFNRGEPVEFVGQVYDASANPIDNAELRVSARQGEKEFETVLRSIGSGRYEGVIEGLVEGDYTFHAVAQTDGAMLGDDRGRFSVGELNLEFQETRMNASLLRQLAIRSGGEFFLPSGIGKLPAAVAEKTSFAPREVSNSRELELWNWEYMLAGIVILFGFEWFLRKRSGML